MRQMIEKLRQRLAGQKVPPPVSTADIAAAERHIGFPLPDLLRELYGTVADGGFGPSYGFLPLLTPEPGGSGCESVALFYSFFRDGDPETPSRAWPERLLPILDWGCAILSCVDCSSPSLAVVRFDDCDSLTVEAPSLELWLNDWIAGRDLWQIHA